MANFFYGSENDGNDGKQSVPVETTTRRELAEMIAEEHDLTVAKSTRILNTVFDAIVDVSNN